MANIKSMSDISKKWIARAAVAGNDYKQGVLNPRRPWEESTKASEENYNAGITAAISRGAFGKGVSEAGNAKWQNRAANLGTARFGQGVQAAKPEFEKGFEPYRSEIASVTLTPRGPKGSPENYDRVRQIGEKLHAKKIA